MRFVPQSLLKKIYNRSSLRNTDAGVRFSIKNRLSPSTLTALQSLELNRDRIERERIHVGVDGGAPEPLVRFSQRLPMDFPLGTLLTFELEIEPLDAGEHSLNLAFESKPFGGLEVEITDQLNTGEPAPGTIPRDSDDDYAGTVVSSRQRFVTERTGVELQHTSGFSFDPHLARGNIEHFTGAAQVPLGIAGPLLVDGRHARGEF